MSIGVRTKQSGSILVGLKGDIVASVNPVAVEVFITTQGTAYDVPAPGLLTGATYSVISAITIVSAPTNGNITAIGLDGSFTYTYTGAGLPDTDSFTFTITDENGTSNVAPGNINALSGFVNKFRIGSQEAVPATTRIIDAAYLGGELVYGTETPLVPTGRLEFAEIPTLVFAVGYAETIDMNIFILDPENRYPAGALPWDGIANTLWPMTIGTVYDIVTNNYVPAKLVDAIGNLPTGLTWNKTLGRFEYDGTIMADSEIPVYFSYDGKISDTFNIILATPKLTWPNLVNVDLHNQVEAMYAANPTEPYPLVLVKDGTYYVEDDLDPMNAVTTSADFQLSCFKEQNKAIFVGEPGKYPILSVQRSTGWDDVEDGGTKTNILRITFDSTPEVHCKGLHFRGSQAIDISQPETVYFNMFNLRISNNKGAVFWGREILTGETETFIQFFSNIEMFWTGTGLSDHAIYMQPQPKYPWDRGVVPDPLTYFNNYKCWEPGEFGQASDYGEALKFTGRKIKVRNTYLSNFRDWQNPDLTRVKGGHLLNLNAHSQAIVYNCNLYSRWSVWGPFGFAARNLTNDGYFYPPYFSYPKIVLKESENFPPEIRPATTVVWAECYGVDLDDGVTPWYSTKDNTYHGTNDSNDYNLTGESYYTIGATVPAPGLLSGATIDPTGVTAITCSEVFSSYRVEVDPSLDGSFFFNYIGKIADLPAERTFTFTITDINGESLTKSVVMSCDTGGAAATSGPAPTYLDTGLIPVATNQAYDLFNINVDSLTINDTPAPTTAPFWDSVGDISDYNNTSEYANHSYVTEVQVYTIKDNATIFSRPALVVKPPYPEVLAQASTSFNALLPVPTNWKPLNHVFITNFTRTGLDYAAGQLTIDDNPDEFAIEYPASKNTTAGDLITIVGGDVDGDTGAKITIPAIVKI